MSSTYLACKISFKIRTSRIQSYFLSILDLDVTNDFIREKMIPSDLSQSKLLLSVLSLSQRLSLHFFKSQFETKDFCHTKLLSVTNPRTRRNSQRKLNITEEISISSASNTHFSLKNSQSKTAIVVQAHK